MFGWTEYLRTTGFACQIPLIQLIRERRGAEARSDRRSTGPPEAPQAARSNDRTPSNHPILSAPFAPRRSR